MVVAIVAVGASNGCTRRSGTVRYVTPLAEVAIAIVRKYSRLVRVAIGRAVGGVSLVGTVSKLHSGEGAHSVVVALWGRGSFSGAQLITEIRTRGRWRGGAAVALAAITILVHGNEDRGGLEQLHLLVLGDEQLGGVLPFRRMFPTKSKVNAELESRAIAVYVGVRAGSGHSS